MKQSIKLFSLAVIAAAITFTSCKKFKEGEGNDEELITTMNLTFTPAGGGTPLVFGFNDADGPGGNPPVQDVIELANGVTYNVTVELLNATTTPPEDITEEVAEENTAHRFYYTPSAGSLLTVSGLNNDDNGMPLGITSQWTAGAASSGTITVTLRHYPGTPPDKQTSDPVNSPKSGTDIEVPFSYTIQ